MSRRSARLTALAHASETMDLVETALPAALERMLAARRGYPGSGWGGGSSSGDHADPTAAAAMRPDIGGDAVARVDELLRQHTATASALFALVSQWAPRAAPSVAKREAERANTVERECAHHRATVDVHVVMHRHTEAGGVLPEPMALCRWCHDFARSKGRLPRRPEVAAYKSRGRVMVRA